MVRSAIWMFVFAGCTRPEITVERVDPPAATNIRAVAVRIEGSGFLPVTSDVDDGQTRVDNIVVTIGDVPLDNIAWRGEQLVEASVPAGLPIGFHDVNVAFDGRSAVLDDGYEVIDPTALCPTTYDFSIAGQTPPSRYRLIRTIAPFATQHAACNADMPGATHLASLDSPTEIMLVKNALTAIGASTGIHYVGGVQLRDQVDPRAGWHAFNGGPLPPNWTGAEPSDADTPAEDNEENLAGLQTTAFLHDVTGDVGYPALCECDGIPIAPMLLPHIPP